MHYNPSSIALVREATKALAEQGALSHILLESCQKRWDAGQKFKASLSIPQRKILSIILESEMQAAAEVAAAYPSTVRLVLADQLIDVTDARVKECLGSTLRDLADPLGGGWGRILCDLQLLGWGAPRKDGKGNEDGDGFLGFLDFAEPKLLASMPVNFQINRHSPLRTFAFYPHAAIPSTAGIGGAFFSILLYSTLLFSILLLSKEG